MNKKRTTIYDIAKVMDLSPSYISKALNDHPLVSSKIKEKVQRTAQKLNYKQNSYAANLRKGISETIGVIVPNINKKFFSEIISGIENVCFENNYGLIICQSQESYEKECKAIETLIRQNVDCILISITAETHSTEYLQNIINNGIVLIQFDRYIENFDCFRVINDNELMAYKATKNLIKRGYKKIVFLGWAQQLTINRLRINGYLRALEESTLPSFIFDNAILKERTVEIATKLLTSCNPPDAFITFADHQALIVLQVAKSLGINVPEQLGIIGSGNDTLTEITTPTLSTIDQKSMELGKQSVDLFFEILSKRLKKKTIMVTEKIIPAKIICRESTMKFKHEKIDISR